MACVSEGDESLPAGIDRCNLVLNRARLATFLHSFATDKDVRDLLTLDALGRAAGAPFTSTGVVEYSGSLASRPFRIWEYVWLYKSLGLAAGGIDVLDLGGPASHICLLAALAGCRVTSIDINPAIVEAAAESARVLNVSSLDARVGDMRDLSSLASESFDAVVSCSVLEHLTASDQEIALREIARVLKPAGLAGLTFDFGPGALEANRHLPPPHEPPESAGEAVRRYAQAGLAVVGNAFVEDPVPGSLFRHDLVEYTVASLFLGRPSSVEPNVPQCEPNGSVLGDLRIEDLPYRVYRCATEIDDLRSRAAALDEARVQLDRATATMQEQQRLIRSLHATAAERLDVIGQLDRALREIRAGDRRSPAVLPVGAAIPGDNPAQGGDACRLPMGEEPGGVDPAGPNSIGRPGDFG
jgi:SAM-dependent methyltransferase